MNRPLKSAEFEPYRPIREGVQFRSHFVKRHVRLTAGYAPMAPEAPDDISSVFNAKDNLRKIRSSILEPGAVKLESIRLAEQALLRQTGASDPERVKMSIDSVALDLSKILD